ncbi:LamG-like jellyroll fold domain-containing protein [Paenibacillus hexagrammi]|uniref:LamG domain-containing protein n=1 Tax=Paenibacillus hexagrammi TaxID=2908839 RepID=A0ABY3SL84_9BACL|nr:LamG-like jellyroll fold domain-containing protein [Paenibacillus sp. YPD9-1]UJF34822.1 LamG domain-containing protein [Paenibacillus sp. YPD9-1]
MNLRQAWGKSMIATVLITSLGAVVPAAAQAATDNGGYLISYFRSDPSQSGEKIQKLHYGYSRDGVKWYELNRNLPVFDPAYELRDPFLNKGPDGIWRLVYTTPDMDANGVNTATYYLGYAESTDLIHWTNQKRLDLMSNFRPANTVYNTWAPEWIYNDDTGKYLIYWSATLNASGPTNNKHYLATTTDWNTFSNASLFFDPGLKTIDADIIRYDKNGSDYYYMFFKDETIAPKKNRQTWASEPANKAEYEDPTHISAQTITPDYTEAPEAFKLIGQNKWNLIYDYWSQGKYGLKSTTNIEDPGAWSAENSNARFPNKIRHAGVATLTESELWNVINEYSLDAHYKLDNNGNDASGNSRNGTVEGSPVFSASGGKNGGYMNFDGVDDGIKLAGSASSGFMHDAFSMRSVSMWIKADNTGNTQLLYEEGGAVAGLALKIESGNLIAGVATGSVLKTVSTPFTDTSSWHHVALVYNEGSLQLYVDGNMKSTLATGFTEIASHSDHSGIGKRYTQDVFGGTVTGAYFKGKMDQVKIFSVPLVDQDITDLYETP